MRLATCRFPIPRARRKKESLRPIVLLRAVLHICVNVHLFSQRFHIQVARAAEATKRAAAVVVAIDISCLFI